MSKLLEKLEPLRELHQLKSQLAISQQREKAARQMTDHLSHELRNANERMQVLLSLDTNTPTAKYQIKPRSRTSESVAAVQFTDWHVEETVKAGSVNGLNRFTLDVASRRIEKLVAKILHLLELCRAGTKIDTLVIHLGGDLMTGYIHMDLIESNSLHPVQAVIWLHEKLSSVLRTLLDESKCKIICVCNSGNHARTTEKKRINMRMENSYEWLLYKILSKQFPEIDWRISEGYFEWLNVYGAKWRFSHGDDIKYMGGVGGITIPVNKAIAQWNKAMKADLDAFGHWHQSIFMRNYICNGSLIGYSAHSLSIKADYEPPTQNLWLWEKDLGRTGMWPIYL